MFSFVNCCVCVCARMPLVRVNFDKIFMRLGLNFSSVNKHCAINLSLHPNCTEGQRIRRKAFAKLIVYISFVFVVIIIYWYGLHIRSLSWRQLNIEYIWHHYHHSVLLAPFTCSPLFIELNFMDRWIFVCFFPHTIRHLW